MNAFIHTAAHIHTASVLLIVLCLCIIPAAVAQPLAPYDQLDKITQIENHLANPSTRARLAAEEWRTYVHQLTGALASDHDGLQQGALRMIIQYGDHLLFKRLAAFDVVHIYRDHPNDNMRRMAVVALGQMHDTWAMDFLKRSARFEKTPSMRHTILSILEADGTLDIGPAKIGG